MSDKLSDKKDLSAIMSIFSSNISYFVLGYSITPFKFYFLLDLAGCVFSLNEVWQQSIYWMFQKHSYKNTAAYPSLFRTSRGYQGWSVVIFFPNPQLAFGGKGMCLCIFFVSWLPDLCSCLHIWFLNALSVFLSLSGMSQRLQMFRVSFPVCLHICAWAWALSVCSHILLCQWKRRFQVFIYPTMPWAILQGQLRTEVCCVKGSITWGLSWTSEHPASHLNICIQSSLTKKVVGVSYLELARHVGVNLESEFIQIIYGINLNVVSMSSCSCLGPWEGGRSAAAGSLAWLCCNFPPLQEWTGRPKTEWATKPSIAQHWNVLSHGQLGAQGLQDLQRKPLV